MLSNSACLKTTSWSSIQSPPTATTIPTTTIFGMNESVCSWIEVAAWKIETSRPTTSPATRNGAETFSVTSIACTERWVIVSWFTEASSSVEGRHERLHHEVPAVHQHEEQDLERQGDEDRGQH